MSIQLSVIKGAMQSLANGMASGCLETLGVLPDQLQLVTGQLPWQLNERNIVVRTLDLLMFGTMDILSLPRFEVPAEYVAATIAMFVSPSNIMVACRWMESSQASADLLGNPASTSQNTSYITSTQLFALVLQLANDGQVSICRNQFEARTALAIKAALKGEENAETPTQKRSITKLS